jgi:hypothetical protein
VDVQTGAAMPIPKRALLLSSAALTFFSQRYAPHLTLFAKSYAKNIATLFVIQLLVQWTWQIVVYPLFLSPLRHLPQPPVGLTFGATAVEPHNTDIL